MTSSHACWMLQYAIIICMTQGDGLKFYPKRREARSTISKNEWWAASLLQHSKPPNSITRTPQDLGVIRRRSNCYRVYSRWGKLKDN